MKVDELSKYGIPDFYIQKLREEKVEELYPPQADIVKRDMLSERNLVISIPTAGGKTLMAALAIIKKFSERKCKAIYIAPLVALASEKYDYFKEMFGSKHKVALSVGDLDSGDPWLAERDIIVCTTEKLDSLTRHNAPWLSQVGLIIVDEIHLLNDSHRGPTLEVLLTKLRESVPKAQILGLSATISNSKELADWLNANLVVSDFRPVKLHEGILYNDKIQFLSHKTYPMQPGLETENAVMHDTIMMKKQALFFLSSRRNAESLAERLASTTGKLISQDERAKLSEMADGISNVLESPTKQCNRLAFCVRHGSAFHHAGLVGKQKRMIENGFREGLIKVITSTPTLAMGVNLPAFRVVIRDAKRFYAGIGSSYIPVMEYKQMSGRAGRPKYDDFGEAILVAKSEEEASELMGRFIQGDVEDIRSKLAVEPVLRMHTLALIASNFVNSEDSLMNFFSKTFYSFQYGDNTAIEEKIVDILGQLVEWEFIEYSKDKIYPTRLGRKVSELYIDPQTAHQFAENLKVAAGKEHNYFSFLHAVCSAKEMSPKLSPKTTEFAEMAGMIAEKDALFLEKVPEEWDLEFDEFVRSVKTTMLFESWMNEETDDKILTEYRVAPGEMRNRLDTTDWLVYSMQEIGLLLGHKSLLNEVRKLRVRLRYGIREELIPLVRLDQVGRLRARRLYRSGFKSLDDLRKATQESISKVVGPKVAASIKKQVGAARIVSRKQEIFPEEILSDRAKVEDSL
ncbi:MAG: DEAD/DEAH box helicase [Candidatus Aenigmarchaeota archaeon]|nr:DEAD/DEAH box helicase [Candidatus Aenigmarchaeota archaeon]